MAQHYAFWKAYGSPSVKDTSQIVISPTGVLDWISAGKDCFIVHHAFG
jgi:hypothetical protein